MAQSEFSSPLEEVLHTIQKKKEDQEVMQFSREMKDSIWILRDLMNQVDTIEGAYISAVEVLKQVMGYPEVYLYMLDEEETNLSSPLSPETTPKFQLTLEKALEDIEAKKADDFSLIPLVGNNTIRKELGFPANPACILGYLAIKPLAKGIEEEFLLRYGRRAGPELHQFQLESGYRTKNQNYKDLLNIVSHELRTPALIITSILKLLGKTKTADGTYPLNQEDFERIRDCAFYIEGEVGKYLNLETIESGKLKLNPERVDLCIDIVEPVLRHVKYRIRRSKRQVDMTLGGIPAGFYAMADKRILPTALMNLFDNAIKHGLPDRPIAYGIKDAGEFWELNVWNSGAIPPEVRGSLFEKFSKGVQSTGTGIGLYESNKIIALHGGRMWVDFGYDFTDFKFTVKKA